MFAAKVSQSFVHVFVAIFSPHKNPDILHDVCFIEPASLSVVQTLGNTFFDMKPGTINLLRAGQTNTIGFTNGFSELAFVVRYGHKFRRISANDIASCSLVGFRSVSEHGASWSDTRRNVLQDARSRHFL